MRNFKGLPELSNASELLSFMEVEPSDHVLMLTSDLDSSDFDGALATRTDDSVLVVYSLRAAGATSIDELLYVIGGQRFQCGVHIGEVAVVGKDEQRDRFGRSIPRCIEALRRDAENKIDNRQLVWCGFEGICVLPSHPEAEAN
ncbi:hypothetical protein ACFQDN_21855 [Pseudomonas asuensis]|uniref:Uncharacterized protein n=1 Tax=Pseudomonas asuensis TaxID=1825787 RepID=A0ABQ2H2Q9_9PSED|nr:hypothetical protein [Pseudomonas asuensis]GGM25357.1 hypothetical protein GCM10009425_40160 [Pseudomonas asuensis]